MMPRPRFTHLRSRPWRRRLPTAPRLTPAELLTLAAATVAMLVLASAHAAIAGATTSSIARPKLTAPADRATTAFAPSFAWKRVAGAARYEFQASADPAFESIVGNGTGSFKTVNTFATVDKALAEGDYFWRVRAIDKRDRGGRWSPVRSFFKRWTVELTSPPDNARIEYPATAVVLKWNPVPGAYKYLFNISTDESMGHSLLGGNGVGVETSATSAAVPLALAPGDYFWTVVPMDAQRHSGTRPTPFKFTVSWTTTGLNPQLTNLFTPGGSVMDPQFSWSQIPGAASFQVEVNPADDWAVGSKVCCDELATGNALSPLALLPNNTYHWRVRAINPDGKAGEWNRGPDFKKGFLPGIEGLRVRDNDPGHDLDVEPPYVPETDSPVIQWDPVPGASSYDVQLAPWEDDSFCNWSATLPSAPNGVTASTAATAWTPLGSTTLQRPFGTGPVTSSSSWKLWQDEFYCVRVRARTDRDAKQNAIVSDWTQIGGVGNPAFYYVSRFPNGCNGTATSMWDSDYHDEAQDGTFRGAPLFSWEWVDGACGYFVVVARDAEFTNIVDVAFTNYPAYAPRNGFGPISYPDETTSYYWAVMPTRDSNGNGLATQPQENAPQSFVKRSIEPSLLSPAADTVVTGQPTFRWTPVEGALDYRIQVDDDPNFSSPIDDVRTHSTGFTSMKTYHTDSVLYWRVRADAENGSSSGTAIGLNWSAVGRFHRDLPIPTPAPTNPTRGDTIPTLTWNPVVGAVSYDIHFEQSDGTKRDFNVRSTAFTPIGFWGTGVWRWQVRANYRSGFTVVSSGYTPLAPFTRHIATPAGLKTTKDGNGALLSWLPAPMAKQYRVQISTSDTFAIIIDQATVDGASFAPRMTQPQFAGKGPLYWRVATLDEGGNAGGWAMAPLRKPQSLRVKVRGTLRHGRTGTLRVTVTDSRGRALKGAAIKARGKGISASSRRTGKRGTATLRLHPRTKGRLRLAVSLRSYTTRAISVRVR